MTAPQPEEDYAWLVDARWRIQTSLLELFELVQSEARRAELEGQETTRQGFGWLLGAAFSLWRAAFLSNAAPDWSGNLKHARGFLEKLLQDNAINYQQDKDTKAWSGGYYLNNSRFRLQMAHKLLSQAGVISGSGCSGILEWDVNGTLERKTDWEAQYGCLTDLIKHLKKANGLTGRRDN